MQENIFIAKNITKQYENHLALDNVSISIPKGSIYGLLGPNGAGKTTLMRIINQITAPDSGTLIFNDNPLKRKHTKEIGYLPEERGLYKKMKVKSQCLYLAQLKGMSSNEAIQKLNLWFEKLEIKHLLEKKVEELSKGMAQKIQFISSIIHEPKLLIFDEPFSGFDPINASLIKNQILSLNKKGITIIFSTHRMESVEEICTDIGLINKSKKILEGSIKDIKKQYDDNMYELVTNTNYDLMEGDSFLIKSKIENTYILKVKENKNHKDILSEIIEKTDIISFSKKLPTIEEIFIKNVNNE